MNRFSLFLVILMLAWYLPVTIAQTGNKNSSPWTINDIINQEGISMPDFSPDGKSIVWVKTRPDNKQDKFVTDLYLTRTDITEKGQFKEIQLTRSKDSDTHPLFSRDGEFIYFLSTRKKGKHLWALSTFGGEAFSVDSFPNGISQIQWLNDTVMTYIAGEGESLYERELKKKKDNVVVVEDSIHIKARRIFSYNLKTKKSRRLTDNHFPVRSYTVSNDGRWMVSSHVLSPHYGVDGKPAPQHLLWDLKNMTSTRILASGFQTPGSFAFTDDNKGFYFYAVQSSDPEWEGAGISLLYHYELSTNKVSTIDLDWKWGMGGGFHISGQDVFVSLANGTTYKLAYFQKGQHGWTKKEVNTRDLGEHVSILKLSKDRRQLIFNYSTASVPTQVHLSDLQHSNNSITLISKGKLSLLNKYLEKKQKAKTEVVNWTGALNENVTGILYYPHNYKAGNKYPLMIAIHGGPAGADMDRWSDRWAYHHNLIAQKGCFILSPIIMALATMASSL